MVRLGMRCAAMLAAVLGLSSCGSDDSDDGPTDDGGQAREALTPVALLTRASLDLRGVRPQLSELSRIEAHPEEVDEMIATFVDDPAFGERVKDMFAGAWRTRIDTYRLPAEAYEGENAALTHAAIGEEPLNLIAYIALNDLSFATLLESPDTFVDPRLMELWPLEPVDDDNGMKLPPGVVRARYVDGRPAAGVLSMNAVYWRHASTVENANRGRANALSQALLCQSYLDRPIDFPSDLDLTDSESIRTAIATNPACQGCHSTLDPLASYLWGFNYGDVDQPRPEYSAANERAWQVYTDAAPGFFGKTGDRMVDLAAHVASDERFVACTVRRVYEGMLGRRSTLSDEGALAVHREAFIEGGLRLKSLARSILTDPSYRGEAWEPRFGGAPEPVYDKVAPVGVLSSSLIDLSGYALTYDGRPATRLDVALRPLAGGSDRGDTTNVSTGAVLVQRRLAQAGALFAVDTAVAGESSGGRLDEFLAGADLESTPSSEDLVALVRLVRSETLEAADPEIDALLGVWAEVAEIESPTDAWVAVVTAALADPNHLLY